MSIRSFLAIALAVFTHAAGAQVYRCGNIYSDSACKGGHAVDTSPALSDPRGATTTVIFLCRAAKGTRYWTPEPCSQNGWTIERTERVPANVPWEDQLASARAQHREARALSAPKPTVSAGSNVNSKAQQCAQLESRVQYLDDEGRRGGGHNKMEWLREERRKARDAQYRQRC